MYQYRIKLEGVGIHSGNIDYYTAIVAKRDPYLFYSGMNDNLDSLLPEILKDINPLLVNPSVISIEQLPVYEMDDDWT